MLKRLEVNQDGLKTRRVGTASQPLLHLEALGRACLVGRINRDALGASLGRPNAIVRKQGKEYFVSEQHREFLQSIPHPVREKIIDAVENGQAKTWVVSGRPQTLAVFLDQEAEGYIFQPTQCTEVYVPLKERGTLSVALADALHLGGVLD